MSRMIFFLRLLGLGLGLFLGTVGLVRGIVWATGSAEAPGVSGAPEVFVWKDKPARSGGYSALLLEAAGSGFLIASDQQHYLTGQIRRDASGRIIGLAGVTRHPVLLHTGAASTKFQGDLEGLARLPDGRIALGFEHLTRLQLMDGIGTVPEPLHRWDRFAARFDNRTFEALATLPDGTLLAIMEEAGEVSGETAAYLYTAATGLGAAQTFPVTPGFSVTGADTGPDGCLYVLERRYSLWRGFEFQLVRMHPRRWQTAPRAVLYRARPMQLGNAEGLSVRLRGETLVASIITDDGFPPLTPTRLIELPLRPAPGRGSVRDCRDR